MKCSYNGCQDKSVIIVSILGIKFGYCPKHKRYANKIKSRQLKHRIFDRIKRQRFGIYELGYENEKNINYNRNFIFDIIEWL